MEIAAVLVAAAAIWAIGAAWYGLMSGPWRDAAGIAPSDEGVTSRTVFGLSYACFVLLCGFLQWIWYLADVQGPAEGLMLGAGVGAFLGVPWMAVNNMYSGRPWVLTLIDGTYAVMGVAAGGAVLELF